MYEHERLRSSATEKLSTCAHKVGDKRKELRREPKSPLVTFPRARVIATLGVFGLKEVLGRVFVMENDALSRCGPFLITSGRMFPRDQNPSPTWRIVVLSRLCGACAGVVAGSANSQPRPRRRKRPPERESKHHKHAPPHGRRPGLVQ